MADVKNPGQPGTPASRPVEAASAAPGEKRSAVRPAAKASESGDAAVQNALAGLQTAQMNAATHKDAADRAAAQAEGHDEEVRKAQDALAELGFE